MVQAQGQYKQLIYKVQGAKGIAASGSGGQLLRRETASLKMSKDTFAANEITSHQQSTGVTFGVGKTDGTLSGVLSPGTYGDFFANVLRQAWAATAALTGLSITIAGAGPYTITRAAGDFLAGGIKVGDIVQLTAGAFTAGTTNKNLLVTVVTAAVITVIVLNGETLTAEGPIATSTLSVVGKKTKAPLTAHTNLYYTFEEWFSDLTRSVVYQDVQTAKIDIGLPSTGNATVGISFMGLDRTKSGAQVLTAPTAETTTPILNATNGYVMLEGGRVLVATSLSFSIDGGLAAGEATIGSKRVGDNVKGDIKVSGTVSLVYDGETVGGYFDDEENITIVAVVTDSIADASPFVAFTMGKVKITSDDGDDGKKQIVKTHAFTAEINGDGGAALNWDKTIITIQDSSL